jgi:hypothetical protein
VEVASHSDEVAESEGEMNIYGTMQIPTILRGLDPLLEPVAIDDDFRIYKSGYSVSPVLGSPPVLSAKHLHALSLRRGFNNV